MNDIQKAMAFLREEREERAAAEAFIGTVPTPEGSPPAPDVEQASSAATALRPDLPRRDTGIGDAVERASSIAPDGRSDARRASTGIGDAVSAAGTTPPDDARDDNDGRQAAGPDVTDSANSVQEAPRAVGTASSRPRSRFDDAMFEDDVLDGIGARRVALDGSEPGDVAPASTSDAEAVTSRAGSEGSADGSSIGREADPSTRAPNPFPDRVVDASAPPSASESVSAKAAPLDLAATEEIGGEHADAGRVPDARAEGERADAGEGGPDRVVSLPLKRLAARGFLTPDAPKGRLSEEFRRVKRPILRNIADAAAGTGSHSNVVMITSSVAGEGKTYTAINLAMSLAAERRRTVLLVDADVLKGSAGAVLGVDGERPGLIDVLDDEHLDIADVMLATDVPDLRFVPAGRRDEHTTELLSSPRMSDLIDELARRYGDRIIVLDCPPMLQTNEANVIADHAGQVVFVVAGEETDQRLVLEAMSRFDEDKSVGVLLNKASGNSASYGYDYGYG